MIIHIIRLLVHFAFFSFCSSHCYYFASDSYCSVTFSSSSIMGSVPVSDTSLSVTVSRSGTSLSSGSTYLAGESLDVSISNSATEYAFTVNSGGAFFVDGSCGNSRSAFDSQLVMPSSGNVVIQGAWANSEGALHVMSTFTLVEPTSLPISASTAPTVVPTLKPTLRPTLKPTASPSLGLASYYISTFAGSGVPTTNAANGVIAQGSGLGSLRSVWQDTLGVVYLSEVSNKKIRTVDTSGILGTFAGLGSGVSGSTASGGPATSTELSSPSTMWGNSVGGFYILDPTRLWYVSNGIISYFAGTGVSGNSGDGGKATSAQVQIGFGVGGDTVGNIYFGDSSYRIRKIAASTLIVTTAAGTGTEGTTGDMYAATSANIGMVQTIFVDTSGYFYFADFRYRLRTVGGGVITTVAGIGTASTDGKSATSSSVGQIYGLWMDENNNLYYTDITYKKIKVITASTKTVYTIAGTGSSGSTGNFGPATAATLSYPEGIWGLASSAMYVADPLNCLVYSLVTSLPPTPIPSMYPTFQPVTAPITYSISALAGSTSSSGFSGDGGQATSALFASPDQQVDIFQDTEGSTYYADSNSRVRKIIESGIITTVVGTSQQADDGNNGCATAASIAEPGGVWVSNEGNIFVMTINGAIRKIDTDGIIDTYAGRYDSGSSDGDGGPATSAAFAPSCVRGDSVGNLYLGDAYFYNIRIVNTFNIIRRYAGSSGDIQGLSGDGGAATSAAFNAIYGLTLNSGGVLYVSDGSSSNRIRKISTTSIITSFAGGGTAGVDGIAATSAKVSPFGLWVDSTGSLFVVDTGYYRIKMIYSLSTLIYTIAGTGYSGISSNYGLATSSFLLTPQGICGDTTGKLLITDKWIARKLSIVPPTIAPTCNPTLTPTSPPSVKPSVIPSVTPSASPTVHPTIFPSVMPTVTPTVVPSVLPSIGPSTQPTELPSNTPTNSPSVLPSLMPTPLPSVIPSLAPTPTPSVGPTLQPSVAPTVFPSTGPSMVPLCLPSETPSQRPSLILPSVSPSIEPSVSPSVLPSPSLLPSLNPTIDPSITPTRPPSMSPSMLPSIAPTLLPTVLPSTGPSESPTKSPSIFPTVIPTTSPSTVPSCLTTFVPLISPSLRPTTSLSTIPSLSPSALPSVIPTTAQPSASVNPTAPSVKPTRSPTKSPSLKPTRLPTVTASLTPTAPTFGPTLTLQPSVSSEPSIAPTVEPSLKPSTSSPSLLPMCAPSVCPTRSPTTVIPTTQVPTAAPSTVEYYSSHPKATLPSNQSISVIGGRDMSFKIVLPFLAMSSGSFGSAFGNVRLTEDPSFVSYVVSGSVAVLATSLSVLASVEYSNTGTFDTVKRSTSQISDVNGDSFDDLIIGDPYLSQCYVLFGIEAGLTAMTKGFTIFGEFDGDFTGWSVSGAGDVNNDTLADIIVGAPNARETGAFYVIYGRRANNFDVYLNNFTSSQGFAIYGAQKSDYLGISVSNAGDVNGDRCDDVIVGSVQTSGYFGGAAYIVYGSKSLTTKSMSQLAAQDFRKLSCPSYSFCGCSVSAAGDVNKDGLHDVIIGSSPGKPSITPASYLVYGSKSATVAMTLTSMASGQGVRISGAGEIVSFVGDADGDGRDDILMGAKHSINSQFGFIVYSNVSLLTLQSPSPSIAISGSPSRIPSRAPVVPTTRPFKNPSLFPSQVPTSPSAVPTAGASVPSTPPIARPNAPTIAPSDEPTEIPTVEPSEAPTEAPTRRSTEAPTTVPSILPTYVPSVLPSIEPSAIPTTSAPTSVDVTRAPMRRPTLSPTVATKPLVTKVYLETATILTNLTEGYQNYIVNTSESVSIYNRMGNNQYTILPSADSVLIIVYFNVSNDLIDLTYFPVYATLSDLTLIEGSVIITLPNNQVVRILNLRPDNMEDEVFMFYKTFEQDKKNNKLSQSLSVVAGIFIAIGGVCLLSILVLHYWDFLRCSLLSKKLMTADCDTYLMTIESTVAGEILYEDDIEHFFRQLDAESFSISDADMESIVQSESDSEGANQVKNVTIEDETASDFYTCQGLHAHTFVHWTENNYNTLGYVATVDQFEPEHLYYR